MSFSYEGSEVSPSRTMQGYQQHCIDFENGVSLQMQYCWSADRIIPEQSDLSLVPTAVPAKWFWEAGFCGICTAFFCGICLLYKPF